MLRLVLVTAALAIVGGCASQPPAPATAQAADGATQVADANANERKQICVREQPIGSATTQTKCHYEEDGVRKAMNMDTFRQQVNQNTRSTVPGSGS